jgi:hypothetical protein
MDVMVSGTERWISLNRELFEKDVDGVAASIKKMKDRQKRMKQIKSLVSKTFSGAKDDILKKLKADIDHFFKIHPGSVMEQTSTFVSQYSLAVENYRDKLASSGFNNTLYLIFQEFKQALDTFMTESINPEVVRFAGKIEHNIKSSLESVAAPYQSMASEEIAELKASVNSESEGSEEDMSSGQSLLDMDALKRITGLSLPSSTAALEYTAKVKTEAVVRLGLYSTINIVKKVFKKTPQAEKEEQMHALTDGFKLIKRETENSIVFHFENYRENFKFQYVTRLLEAAAAQLNQLLMERFQVFDTNISALETMVKKEGKEREEMILFFDRISRDIQNIRENITKCRGALEFQ